MPLHAGGAVRAAGALAGMGPGAAQLLDMLRNQWLPAAGLAVGSRAIIMV
jgi:hypothetical protein